MSKQNIQALGRALDRRSFVRQGAALAAAFSVSRPLQALADRCREPKGPSPDYGPLVDSIDGTTGLPLLQLPEPFKYFSFGWRGDLMEGGLPTPGGHDGAGVVDLGEGNVVYIRNHELGGATPFAPPAISYDAAGGGTTNVWFDENAGRYLKTVPSLSGTIRNCAGGLTTWGSWLTCEEDLTQPGGARTKTHGWVFDVPAVGPANPSPITGLGRFNHEAAAVDPATGIVYETEDQSTSGLYRFLPNQAGDLHAGGTLQMLKVVGQNNYDTGVGQVVGQPLDIEWVTIADPTVRGSNGLGVYSQGAAQGGARIRRGEGMWYGDGFIYFISTNGGNAGAGQVWELDPQAQTLRLIYESPGNTVLDGPDNITVSPRGGLLLCEDGGGSNGQYLRGLTREGVLFDFARNNIVLNGEVNGLVGDFRGSEWAGAAFTPNGHWLLVSIQSPGVTFAIKGPWKSGAL